MGLWYCIKHAKMVQGDIDQNNHCVELNCGCKLNKKKNKELRVCRKIVTTYHLIDGREIKKVVTEDKWIIE